MDSWERRASVGGERAEEDGDKRDDKHLTTDPVFSLPLLLCLITISQKI